MDKEVTQLKSQLDQLRAINALTTKALAAYENVNTIIKNQAIIHESINKVKEEIEKLNKRIQSIENKKIKTVDIDNIK